MAIDNIHLLSEEQKIAAYAKHGVLWEPKPKEEPKKEKKK